MGSLTPLRSVRDALYACFARRADALFEVADALLAQGPVLAPPHLCLTPLHRRGWGSIYDGLAEGRINTVALRDAIAARPLAGGESVYATEVSIWARSDAEASPERGYDYHRVPALRPLLSRRSSAGIACVKGRTPRRHGAKFACADPATWFAPAAEHRTEDEQYGTVRVRAWGGLHPKQQEHPGGARARRDRSFVGRWVGEQLARCLLRAEQVGQFVGLPEVGQIRILGERCQDLGISLCEFGRAVVEQRQPSLLLIAQSRSSNRDQLGPVGLHDAHFLDPRPLRRGDRRIAGEDGAGLVQDDRAGGADLAQGSLNQGEVAVIMAASVAGIGEEGGKGDPVAFPFFPAFPPFPVSERRRPHV